MTDETICTKSIECDGSDVVKECFEYVNYNDRTNFCDCSPYFGYFGEECDQLSSTVYFMRSTLILFLIWSTLLFIVSSRTLFLNWFIGYDPKRGMDPVNYTLFSILFSSISLFSYAFLHLLSNLNPEEYVIVEQKSFSSETSDYVTAIGGETESFCLLAFILFNLVGVQFMMASWLKVIRNIYKFASVEEQKGCSQDDYFKWFFRLFFIVFLIFTSLRQLFGAFLVVAFVAIVTVCLFAFNGVRFNKLILNLDENNTKTLTLTINLVKKVTLITNVCAVFIVVFFGIHMATLSGINQNIRPGEFNYSLVFRDLAILFILILMTVYAWYVNSVTEGVLVTDEWKCCVVFSCWDAKNKKLMPDFESGQLDVEVNNDNKSSAVVDFE